MTLPIYVSATSRSNGSSTSVTLNRPSGLLPGDLMVACINFGGGSGVSITGVPSGWNTPSGTARVNSTTTFGLAVYWKFYATGDPSTFVWTLGTAQTNSGQIMAYRVADPFSTISGANGQSNGSSTTCTSPGLTLAGDNEMLDNYYCVANVATFTPGGSQVERLDANSSCGVEEYIKVSGATGTRTVTASAAGVNIGMNVGVLPYRGLAMPMMGCG